MSVKLSREALLELADKVDRTSTATVVERSFGLPTRLFGLTVGAYLAFLAVMALTFQSRHMILPMAIFVIYIVMAFGVPALWTRMKPDHGSRATSWSDVSRNGFECMTGRVTARDATLQVLILPVLILAWGVIISIIAALV